ncbi:MAG: type II methionyl aminopeptidase [Candidatus Nanoarchaeia archaeon]
MGEWEKAGKIAAEVLEFGKKLIKPDVLLLEVAEKIDEKIISLGGKSAFPVNISINHIAAHYSPYPDDKTSFQQGDVVKLDVGVHIDGAIGDTACTIDLGDNKDLVEASEKALQEALKMFVPGTKIGEIGKVVQNVIKEYNFVPIINLTGHQVEKYNLHAGIVIPNYDNGDPRVLKEGQIFAVEPFATNGEGKVIEGKPSSIYKLATIKQVRDQKIRKMIQFIAEEYHELPFAKRWVVKKFPNANFALTLLEKEGILHHYPQLPEKTKGLVSQAEHTVIVGEKPKITTKI